jgi:hypothetical protein
MGGLPLFVCLALNPFTSAIASLLHHRQAPPLFPPEQSSPPALFSSNKLCVASLVGLPFLLLIRAGRAIQLIVTTH